MGCRVCWLFIYSPPSLDVFSTLFKLSMNSCLWSETKSITVFSVGRVRALESERCQFQCGLCWWHSRRGHWVPWASGSPVRSWGEDPPSKGSCQHLMKSQGIIGVLWFQSDLGREAQFPHLWRGKHRVNPLD